MASTSFSGPVTSTNGFVGAVTGAVTGATTGAVTASALTLSGVSAALTAFAGGGKASALQLAATVNRVTVAASAADSVKMPVPTAIGQVCIITNQGANAIQVFGSGTDTIDGVATATGVSQPASTTALYIAVTIGTAAAWVQLLGAA